jgi:hypothetical protein
MKERCRATRQPPVSHNPQARDYPHCTQCRQAVDFFPTKGGVSDTLSPKTIMSGEMLDYKKHMSLQLEQYCQVHEEDNPRNSQISRNKGVISLGPSGNLQGGFKFIALNSGKKIVLRSWDVIPMPDIVIHRVNALDRDQPQHMTFTDKHRRLIGDVEIPGVDDEKENDDHLPGVVPVIADDIEITGVDAERTETQDAVPDPQVEIDDLDIHHADPAPI